jgi:hypothetical protein
MKERGGGRGLRIEYDAGKKGGKGKLTEPEGDVDEEADEV